MSGDAHLTSPFATALALLGMERHQSNLYFVSQKKELQNSPDIFIHLERAERFKADAVYFRYFNDGRPPRSQLYIYDRSSDLVIDEEEAKYIHKMLWNAGVVPLFYVVTKSEITVFNCLEGKANEDGFEFHEFDKIKLTGEAEKARLFSAKQFDSGLFWENEKGRTFNNDKSAYEQLIKQLKAVRKKIVRERGSEHEQLIKRLLVIIILIKYLEDRTDSNGRNALPQDFLEEYSNTDGTLESIVSNPDSFKRMLKELASQERFNGQVFSLSDDEEKQLVDIPMDWLSMFAAGDFSFAELDRASIGQTHFWKLYSFQYLPIELISHIYEDFLTNEKGEKEKGVVYTPPYLVQFLVDQCLPLEKVPEQMKVLDPACGSGIFLVGVFKRLVQAWRRRNNWIQPTADNIPELQRLLKESIFGCDIKDEAVDLTYFSLSLALLDTISPKEIWGNVKFKNLIGENLFKDDFFQLILDNKLPTDFDLVIGNPPFNSKLTKFAEKINKREIAKIQRPDVPDKQIALLFLEQGFHLLKPHGRNCLILTAGPLIYNKNSFEFRKNIFSRFHFEYVYDYIAQRQTLFKGSSSKAAPASIAVSAVNKKPVENDSTYHVILRRSNASKDKVEFETDYYDIQVASLNAIIKNERLWQINFFGGGRLHNLWERIIKLPTINNIVDEKTEKNQWVIGEGWIENSSSNSLQRLIELDENRDLAENHQLELKELKDKYTAPWLTNQRFLATELFDEYRKHRDDKCHVKYFLRNRSSIKNIFKPPYLLIKESVKGKKLHIIYSEEYLTFTKSIIGIHSPIDDKKQLLDIKRSMENAFSVVFVWLNSSKMILMREGVPLKGDILSIPYFAQNNSLNNEECILLKDVLHSQVDFRLKGEKSIALKMVNDEMLNEYGDIYCRVMNSLYKSFKTADPIVSDEFVCFPFIYGDEAKSPIPKSIEKIEEHLSSIINFKASENLWIKRIVRVYDNNVIYFFKPNQKRYWTRSIAMRDADDTFEDLLEKDLA